MSFFFFFSQAAEERAAFARKRKFSFIYFIISSWVEESLPVFALYPVFPLRPVPYCPPLGLLSPPPGLLRKVLLISRDRLRIGGFKSTQNFLSPPDPFFFLDRSCRCYRLFQSTSL